MKTLALLAVPAGAAAATALFAAPAGAAPTPSHSGHPGPVFVQNDNPAGNTVYVYNRNAHGALRAAGSYATGGLGGQLTDSVVDHLAGQGSLTYDRHRQLLYAVNAGSNTLTVFAVHGDRLTRRQVVSTGGQFPLSVTTHGRLVYVLNAKRGGSVEGYLEIGGRLYPAWHRDLDLPTAVPSGTPAFLTVPGQIAFTPDGRDLVITTKGATSSLEVIPLNSLGGTTKPVVTNDVTSGSANVPFAVAFDSFGGVDVAEAGANTVARYAINPDGTLTLTDRIATNGAATCWIVSAPSGRRFYVDNAGSATVTTATLDGQGALHNRATTSTDGGDTDATVTSDGGNLYVQGGAQGVVDEFAIGAGGALTSIGSVTVPNAVGGEGIASA